jgi:MFS family permease
LGYKRALLVFNLIAMSGYLIVILFPSWIAVIIGSVFFLSWTAISLPATMSLVAAVLPNQKRTMGVSMHSLVRRIPMALGPVIGGLLISLYGETTGVRLAFAAAMVLGFIALVLQQLMVEDKKTDRKVMGNPLSVFHLMSPNLRRLLVSDILVRFCEQIPYAFRGDLGDQEQWDFAPAIRSAHHGRDGHSHADLHPDRLPGRPQHQEAVCADHIWLFHLFPLILIFSRSFPMLVLAFVIRGFKEFGEPTRKALIMDLAPEDRKASMFGLYYLLRDVIVSFAAFGGALLWNISPETNFLVAFGFGLLGTFYFAIAGKDLSGKGVGHIGR